MRHRFALASARQPGAQTLRLAAAAVLVAAGTVATAWAAHADPMSDASCLTDSINQARVKRGLPALAVNNDLVGIAQGWAAHLAASNGLSHDPNLASQAPSNWQALGENVGAGSGCGDLAAAFVASPEHLGNMIGSYDWVGVGVASHNGWAFAVEDFMAAAVGPSGPEGAAATTGTAAHSDSYRLVTGDGAVLSYGASGPLGNVAAATSAAAATPTGKGYWLVGADGRVTAFGDAGFHGSLAGSHLANVIVGTSATPDGAGYWLVGRDGGIFAFGDARFFGSTGAAALNQPIVAMASTPSGRGYWLVASDGGVFAFGDASFYGSTGAMRLNQPIVAMRASPQGDGYRFVAADGGVFSFGDVPFYGSAGQTPLNSPVVTAVAGD